MKKVSVIIPIYNVSKYLDECLISIENQTIGLDNLEVILINDGSKDNSLDIMKKYQKKHQDWIIIDRENKGLSISRNEGIKKSKCPYIMFVDSDDYLDNNAIKDMYELANKTDSDIVIGRLNGFDSKGMYGYYSDKYINERKTFNFNENKKIVKVISVCSKLYKKDLIKNIEFIEKIKHEDNYFTLSAYKNAKKISTIPNYYYYRRYREGERDSITQNLSIDTFNDLIKNYLLYFKNYNKDNYIIRFSIRYFNNYIISNLKEHSLAKKSLKLYLKDLKNNNIINNIEYSIYALYSNLYYIFGLFYYKLRSNLKK